MKVGFIGIGNMAGAIIKGMIQQEHTKPEDIYVSNLTPGKLNAFTAETGAQGCESNEDLITKSDVVVLAVKPNVIPDILPGLSQLILEHQPLVISIAAGIPLAKLEILIGKNKSTAAIVRAMPNLNSLIGEGMTAVCSNQQTTPEQSDFVLAMFRSIGEAIVLKEADFSTFIAIAGSSPAYTFLFIDSLARGAVKNGIPKNLATKIAAQAVLGSAKMILESDDSPFDLIDKVSSPGGTTVAGIVALEDEGFISTVIKGVDATIKRDKEMLEE